MLRMEGSEKAREKNENKTNWKEHRKYRHVQLQFAPTTNIYIYIYIYVCVCVCVCVGGLELANSLPDKILNAG